MQDGLVLLCLLSEFSRCHGDIFFEKINKVICIFISDHTAYFMDRKICGKQYFFCFFDAMLCQILKGGQLIMCGKFPAEPVTVNFVEIFKVG